MRAQLIARVLRGNHEKRRGQGAGLSLCGHLTLLHRLQQGALGARPGPVDLVGQQHLSEHRPGVEDEILLVTVVHAHADQVGRQQVGRELDARKAQTQAVCQSVRQGGFPHAGHVFNQQVTRGQQTDDTQGHLLVLAHNDRANLINETRDLRSLGWRGRVRRGGGRRFFAEHGETITQTRQRCGGRMNPWQPAIFPTQTVWLM